MVLTISFGTSSLYIIMIMKISVPVSATHKLLYKILLDFFQKNYRHRPPSRMPTSILYEILIKPVVCLCSDIEEEEMVNCCYTNIFRASTVFVFPIVNFVYKSHFVIPISFLLDFQFSPILSNIERASYLKMKCV